MYGILSHLFVKFQQVTPLIDINFQFLKSVFTINLELFFLSIIFQRNKHV